MKIGFYDSGIGGISVLKRFIEQYSAFDYVYFGDSLRAPYGEKSPEELLSYVSVFINPVLSNPSEELEEMDEGCLSIPGIRGSVVPDRQHVRAHPPCACEPQFAELSAGACGTGRAGPGAEDTRMSSSKWGQTPDSVGSAA